MKKIIVVCAVVALAAAAAFGCASEPVPTAVESAEASAAEAEGLEPSNDLLSYEVQFDGVVYKLPFAYKDLVLAGWTLTDGDTAMLASAEATMDLAISKGGQTANISLANLSDKELSYAECMVAGFTVYEGDAPLILPQGIKIGSTQDEVIAAYGEPTTMDAGGTHTSIYYGPDDGYSGAGLQTDLETTEVIRIIIRNTGTAEVTVAG